MPQRIDIDARAVARQIARLLGDYPELAYDETLAHDMMEGATDLHDVVRRALDARAEARGMADVLKARKAEMHERQQRLERRGDAMDRLIFNLLDAAGLPKIEMPEATISLRPPKAGVEVHDVDALPQGFFRLSRSADKTAIAAALKAGEDVPGATLNPGSPGITVRTK